MYYHYPYTGRSAYVLWKRLISKRKTGIGRIRMKMAPERVKYKFMVLTEMCKIGDLSSIVFLLSVYNLGYDPSANNYEAFRAASYMGHLHIVKWLYHMGLLDHSNLSWNIGAACTRGHLHVVKWLHKKLDTVNDEIFVNACQGGRLNVVKWLYSIGYDPQANDNNAICWTINRKHQDVVDFLVSVGCPDPIK